MTSPPYKTPSIGAFGIAPPKHDKDFKYNIPHYAQLPNIYPNSRILELKSSSAMYSRNAWLEVDFWNSDSDVFYVEDNLSFTHALATSGNHYSYFSPFLKLYRVAHSDCTLSTLGLTKNDAHVLEILNNFIHADLCWISPILEERLKPALKKLYSKNMRTLISDKTVVLPYPSFYKLNVIKEVHPLRITSKKPLVFLWNHRLTANKNFKDFCSILVDFKSKYPEVTFTILFVCNESKSNIEKALPRELKSNMDYRGFFTNTNKYIRVLQEANITIATSKLESYGNSVFDAIRSGILLINQDCNDALAILLGSDYTYSKKEIPDILYKAYKSSNFREAVHDFNITGMNSIPSAKKHYKVLSSRLEELVQQKKDSAPTLAKSKVVQTLLKALDSSTLTKKELYKTIDWSTGTKPLNNYWAGYYYALRREGVLTTVNNGRLLFHTSEKPNDLQWGQ